jgi:putative FmdB family regulatory protein
VPTYQYTCTECGEPVEALQKFTDAPLTKCAACGGRLRKVFSPVGIVFKGSGFYRTDSRKAASASDTPSDTKKDKQPSESSPAASNGSPAAKDAKDAKPKDSAPAPAKPSSSEKVA